MRITMAAVLMLAGCSDAVASQEQAAAPAARQAAHATRSGTAPTAFRTVEVVDRTGFGQPMIAARASVPADWRVEGGVNWDDSTNCAMNRMKFQWRAVAPDGVEALELMPGFGWQMPSAAIPMNPCPVAGIASARQFLDSVAQAMRPGARMIGYRDRQDLTAEARRSDRNGYRTEVGEMTLSYAIGGQPVEEQLMAVVSLSGAGGTAGYVSAYRAPAGRLDRARADRIRGSFKGNPEYVQAIGRRGMDAVNRFAAQQSAAISSWHNARMAEINAKGAADRAAIRARGNAETNAIYARTAASTAATNDRIHESNVRSIREETTWTNPAGQTVQGSIHGGSRVLEMSDGSFTRTDDPYYNPAGSTEYSPD
jgi:hypothetical protein